MLNYCLQVRHAMLHIAVQQTAALLSTQHADGLKQVLNGTHGTERGVYTFKSLLALFPCPLLLLPAAGCCFLLALSPVLAAAAPLPLAFAAGARCCRVD